MTGFVSKCIGRLYLASKIRNKALLSWTSVASTSELEILIRPQIALELPPGDSDARAEKLTNLLDTVVLLL
jgi:hypothetical protein